MMTWYAYRTEGGTLKVKRYHEYEEIHAAYNNEKIVDVTEEYDARTEDEAFFKAYLLLA